MTSLAGVHSDADAKIGSHTGPSVHSDKEKNFEPGHATSALTKAAQEEHALTPLQAIKTYWKAFFWCM
jgi:hypothetical protein